MRRFGLFSFNVVLGVAIATAFAWLIGPRSFDLAALEASFLAAGWAGVLVGGTVGLGATVGPRPALPLKKCVTAQLLIVVTTAIGAFLGSSFMRRELSGMDLGLSSGFASRGTVRGSGLGAIVGTLLEVVHIYRMRRRR
jgi:opacity protein-like surface antigen